MGAGCHQRRLSCTQELYGRNGQKKSVIGRACKMIINSSDDAYLFEGKHDEFDKPDPLEVRESLKNQDEGGCG